MPIIVPNTGSTFAAAACVVGSENKWIWLGFRTAIGASGTVTWYRTSTCTSGCEIMTISSSPGQTIGMFGPFNSPCGIYAAGVSGGCAIAWMKL